MNKIQTVTLYSSAYGSYSLQVVGEDSYQDEIKQVIAYDDDQMGKFREDGLSAALVLEDDSPHDRGYAVRVDIDHRTVGYLSRPDARKYRAGLAEKNLKNVIGTCYAVVAGRYNDEKEDMLFGVWLDLDVDRLVVVSRSDAVKSSTKKTKTENVSKSSNAVIFMILIFALLVLGVVGVVIDQVSLVLENSGRLPTRTPTLAPTPNMMESYHLTLTAVESLISTPTP